LGFFEVGVGGEDCGDTGLEGGLEGINFTGIMLRVNGLAHIISGSCPRVGLVGLWKPNFHPLWFASFI
jgi:hypothetical protein